VIAARLSTRIDASLLVNDGKVDLKPLRRIEANLEKIMR
jgi:uncharacterized membrane protein YcaP (DUF421 family)